MLIQQLPYEILENIFRTIQLARPRERNLINCSVVCQAWHMPACRVLFEKLNVRDINQLLNHLINQNSNLGIHCKVIQFHDTHVERETPLDEHVQLFSYLPNVKSIILDSSSLRIQHLNQITQHFEHIKHLKEILLEGSWRLNESQAFYNCANAFKTTLQHFKLRSLGENVTSVEGRVGNMYTLLSEFTALTSLEIENLTYTSSNSPQLSMFRILRQCPNLISFSLENSFEEPEEDDNDHTFDHSKLKYLHLSLPDITRKQINYMIANITQLKELRLECGSTTKYAEPVRWMDKLKSNDLHNFQKYLASIEKVHLDMKGNYITNINEYWPFVSGISADTGSVSTDVCVEVYDRGVSYYSGEIRFTKRMNTIFLYCSLNVREFPPISELLTSPVPLQQIMIPRGLNENDVQTFSLRFDSSSNGEIIYDLYPKIFELITSSFKNLRDINIRKDFADDGCFQIRIASGEIADSKHFSDRSRLTTSRTLPSSKLEHAILRSIHSTEDVSSALRFSPNIKFLKLINCNPILDDNFNITLNLHSLQLRQLIMNLPDFTEEDPDIEFIVLEIEEKELERTSCYSWSRGSGNIMFEPVETSLTRENERFLSPSYSIISIKCSKLDQLEVNADIDDYGSTIVTLNLPEYND